MSEMTTDELKKIARRMLWIIPAMLLAMIGDYCMGIEPKDSYAISGMISSGWLTIADWRIAVSNIGGLIGTACYTLAALPFVREKLVEQQRKMGSTGGIVMDGRDIGTVVFPDAELKIFVTASAEVRAQRRYKELLGKGMPADYDEILRNVEERDYMDSHRETSPLRKADDAIELDNSHMTIAEQQQWLMEKWKERAGL